MSRTKQNQRKQPKAVDAVSKKSRKNEHKKYTEKPMKPMKNSMITTGSINTGGIVDSHKPVENLQKKLCEETM